MCSVQQLYILMNLIHSSEPISWKVVLCKCFGKKYISSFNHSSYQWTCILSYFFFLRGAAGGFAGCSLVSSFSSSTTAAEPWSSLTPPRGSSLTPPRAGGSLVLSLPLSSSTWWNGWNKISWCCWYQHCLDRWRSYSTWWASGWS